MINNFTFNIIHKSKTCHARTGELLTPHGIIQTPNFIFCATKAAIKAVPTDWMQAHATQFILANTYHLMLQPGSKVIAKLGGLHKFMNWRGPMLTDSGGFQIFSLGNGSVADEIKGRRNQPRSKTLIKIEEEGAKFRSYIDGSTHILTPEKSIQIQRDLGADIILVFDECTPFNVDKSYTQAAMERSHRWEKRSLQEFERNEDGTQALYGIVQGGIYQDLRTISADFVNNQEFFGHAIGGSLGGDKLQMYDIVDYTKEKLNPERPTHLLGIGDLPDIFRGVEAGIDTFDCVHPTRIARHGGALISAKNHNIVTKKNSINLYNSAFKFAESPIEIGCGCNTCTNYSRAYLHHLLKAKELLAFQLITIHNVMFMNNLMSAIRNAIVTDSLNLEKNSWLI